MNLTELHKLYNTKTKCYKHLERIRWDGKPKCPTCENSGVTKRKKEFRYHCNKCNKDFSVLKESIFEDSKLPLPIWFQLISLMLNARKGISAMQLSRDLGISYDTAWYCAMRVRCAMVDDTTMLENIVEMDEAYIGGSPRRRGTKIADDTAMYSSIDLQKPKRGRGTSKLKVVGVVERGTDGRVSTQLVDRVDSKTLLSILKRYVKLDNSIVMTDEYPAYKAFDDVIQHLTINHKVEYARGIINTNTIEGFWSIVKNGIRGQYHVLSKKYLPFYLAEFAYKYNRRNNKKFAFDETLKHAMIEPKQMNNYKPKKAVKKIVYRKNDKSLRHLKHTAVQLEAELLKTK